MLALDPGHVVDELARVPVLGLRALVERRAGQAGVAGPVEVGKRAGVEGALRLFKPGNARLLVEVGARQIGLQLDQSVQRVEAKFVDDSRPKIAGDADGVVLAARARVGDSQSRRSARLAQGGCRSGCSGRRRLCGSVNVWSKRGSHWSISRAVEGENDKPPPGVGAVGQILVEELRLRREPVGGNPVAGKRARIVPLPAGLGLVLSGS